MQVHAVFAAAGCRVGAADLRLYQLVVVIRTVRLFRLRLLFDWHRICNNWPRWLLRRATFSRLFPCSSRVWPQSPGHVYVHTSGTVPVKRWGMGCSLTEVALSEIPVQQISLRKAEAGCGRKGRAAGMKL